MIKKLKNKLILLVEIVHRRIFGHEMSDEMRKFLGNLSWSFFGGMIASIAMMVVNIVAGRLIGPGEYGKYALVLTVSQLLMVPIIFGLDVSSVWSVARAKNKKEASNNISSSFYFIVFALVIFSLVFVVTNNWVSDYFGISKNLLIAVFILTITFSLKSIGDAFMRGLHRFKTQFFARIIEISVIILFFVLFFFYFKNTSFFYYIITLSLGAFFLFLWYFKKLYSYLGKFNLAAFEVQFSYGKIILIGSVLGMAFNSLDKIIIAKYLNFTQLGIYSAYFMASTNLIAQLTQMFVNVFLPAASRIDDKSFVNKMKKIYVVAFIPGLLIISFMVFLIVSLFGKAYGINWEYVLCFGFLATLQIILTIDTTIITAISKNLYRKYVIDLNILNGCHIVVYGLLIYFQAISLLMLIGLSVLNVLITIFIQKHLIKNYFKDIKLG